MSSLARRVWPLRWIGLAARTRVLAGALRLANADEAGDIAEELMGIARARPDSTAVPALVSRWSALTARQRSELALIVEADWPMLLTYLGTDPDPRSRASVAAACGEVGGPAVMAAPTLVGFLADGDEGVAANAERSLGAFMRMLGERTLDGRAREAVLIAADGAIESFDRHRRSGALRAAIAHGLVAPGGVGGARGRGRWMSDPDHPAQMVVRGLIRTSEDPAMRSCAWVWLKHGSLATACAERLTQSDSLAEQSVVLERSHLALNRVRARGLSASGRVDEKRFAGALPRLSQFDGLSVGARRGLARWLETLPIGARLRDAASAVLLTDPDAQARQSLAISAARADRPPACLLDLVFDAEGAVASSAGDAVLSRAGADALPEGQRERLAAVLMRSGHESLRRLAEQVRQRAGGSVRARTSDDLERLLGAFIASGAEGASAREVASAVAGAGAVGDGDASIEPVLLRAVQVPDARVRANAVEGLLRCARRRPDLGQNAPIIEVFLDRATDPNHRIRANAARALMMCGWAERPGGPGRTLLGAGTRTLHALLTDARTMHRVAGLWLAHRLGDAVVRDGGEEAGAQLIDRIGSAQARAVDPMERRWVERAGAKVESCVRRRWAGRAAVLREVAA